MNEIYSFFDKAICLAVDTLYLENDLIELHEQTINKEQVPHHVYAGILERIKYNADMHGQANKDKKESRIIVQMQGREKRFQVTASGPDSLRLTAV